MIVGNSAAGVAAAAEARKQDASASITLIGAESYLAYHRPRLTYVLGKGIDVSALLLHSEKWYQEHRIDVRVSERILSGAKGYVEAEAGQRYEYDSLVLATGGLNATPPIPGVDMPGVFSLRTYDDLRAIERYARDKHKVTIIGGGLLGLEAAWSFTQWGKQVSVLERGAGLLKNQLDQQGMETLGSIAAERRINVIYKAETERILGQSAVSGVLLKDGRQIETDVLLLSTGVKADLSLARELGLATGRGVIVDSHMQARAGVFAAGDVAEYNGNIGGSWAIAEQQGRVAGANAAGGNYTYQELPRAATTMVMGVTVFSSGDTGRGEGPYETLVSGDARTSYRSLYFLGERLVGAILIGDAKKAQRLRALIESGGRTGESPAKHKHADSFLDTL